MVSSGQRTYVPNCEADVFISYGHIDNQHPSAGWVKDLRDYLSSRLRQLLTPEVEVWMDPKLDGGDLLNAELERRASASAVLISVLSPRYLTSSYCQSELKWFEEAANRNGSIRVGNKSRVIRVIKTPLMHIPEPEVLGGTLGYRFYARDEATQRFEEFSSKHGYPRYPEFLDECEKLSQELAGILDKMRAERQPKQGPGAKTLYLAETVREWRDARSSIRNELIKRGHTVLPAEALPLDPDDLKKAIIHSLSQADISVHLLGRTYGLVPEGENRSAVEIQYEMARSNPNGNPKRVAVWIPEGLEEIEDRQAKFISRVKDVGKSGGNHDNGANPAPPDSTVEVFETGADAFKEGLLDMLVEKPKKMQLSGSGGRKRVYVVCGEPDLPRKHLLEITSYLRTRNYPVETPVFQGDPEELREAEEEIVGDTGGALIYYGSVKDLWVRRKRKSLIKIVGALDKAGDYVRALYVCVPKDEIKNLTYLQIPEHILEEDEGFRPLLILGDCDEFSPEKLEPFLQALEAK